MKLVIQRVAESSVAVDAKIVGEIKQGLLVFIGITQTDTKMEADRLIKKLLNLRIFEDEQGKTNLSLKDVEGGLLLVSQFTLYANCKKGNRPSFTQAAGPDTAEPLYNYIVDMCREKHADTQTGIFGASMQIQLVNDGPFTVILE